MTMKIHHNKYNNRNTQYHNNKLFTIMMYTVDWSAAVYLNLRKYKIHAHTSGNKID